MRSLRTIIAGVAIGAFGLTQLAADAREQFELRVSKQLIPEAGPMAICLLMTGKDAYSFLPPANWRIEADKEERKVSLIAPDRTLITIHTVKSGEIPTSGPKLEELRNQLLGRFRGARVIEESDCYAEGGVGRAFDLEWKAESGARFTTRVAMISVKGETVEIILTAKPELFRSHHVAFSGILTSFQTAANGQP